MADAPQTTPDFAAVFIEHSTLGWRVLRRHGVPARRWRSACALALVLVWQSIAAAQAIHVPALHWARAASAAQCIDPRALAGRVESLTGPVLVAPGRAEVSIEGFIEAGPPDQPGFRVRLSVTDPRGAQTGERSLEFAERDCRALDGALTRVIATLIDPSLGSTEAPASRERQRTGARRFEVGVGPLVGSGPTGGVATGALASASWFVFPALAVRAAVDARFGLDSYDLDSRRSLHAYAIGAAVLACSAVPLASRLSLPGCIGPDVAFAFARGEGFSNNHTARVVSAGARTSLGLQIDLAPWSLDLLALVRVGFSEKQFVYARTDTDYRAARLARIGVNALLELSHAF